MIQKYCFNCKHFRNRRYYYSCAHPKNLSKNLITGISYSKKPIDFLRSDPKSCGIEGNWFEPKTFTIKHSLILAAIIILLSFIGVGIFAL